MKKAQMINSEIFIYILALVVTSLILLYGYSAVKKMREQTNTVSVIQFKTELTNTIGTLSHEYGSVEIKKFSVPSGTREVCFLWLEEHGGNPLGSTEIGNSGLNNPKYTLVKNSADEKARNNIFVLGDNIFEPFYSGAISIENSFGCFTAANGFVEIRMEAKGKTVEIGSP